VLYVEARSIKVGTNMERTYNVETNENRKLNITPAISAFGAMAAVACPNDVYQKGKIRPSN
jgi:hypothetical protein